MILSLLRILRFAWQGFWRNFWLSVITISILSATFLTINFIIILNLITTSSVQSIQDRVDVSIYFEPHVLQDQLEEVKDFLSSHPQVKEVKIITSEQALEEFRLVHQNDKLILESLEELGQNPLGPTMIVRAENVGDYTTIESILENSKFQNIILDKNFDDNQKLITIINDISGKIKIVGLAVVTYFAFIAMVVILNIIRFSTYTHREEISIMRLVGANNSFISGPFLVESIFYALIACAVSIMVTYPLLDFIQPYLTSFFQEIQINLVGHFNKNFVKIFGMEFIAIVTFCLASSMIAIRRYLKV